jgi:hypothetical protein
VSTERCQRGCGRARRRRSNETSGAAAIACRQNAQPGQNHRRGKTYSFMSQNAPSDHMSYGHPLAVAKAPGCNNGFRATIPMIRTTAIVEI